MAQILTHNDSHPLETWLDGTDRDYIGDWGDEPINIEIDIFAWACAA